MPILVKVWNNREESGKRGLETRSHKGWKLFIFSGVTAWQPGSEVKKADDWLIQNSLVQTAAKIRG